MNDLFDCRVNIVQLMLICKSQSGQNKTIVDRKVICP